MQGQQQIYEQDYRRNLAHGQCKNSQVTSQASVSQLIPLDRRVCQNLRYVGLLDLYIVRSLDHQIVRSLHHQIIEL